MYNELSCHETKRTIITWQDEICHVCWLPLRLCVCVSVCLCICVSSKKFVRSLASLVLDTAIIFSEQLGIVALRR